MTTLDIISYNLSCSMGAALVCYRSHRGRFCFACSPLITELYLSSSVLGAPRSQPGAL